MLMLGNHYFKSWDINFTNKTFKENSNAMITMRLEKENEFVGLEFIKGTEMFVLLSRTGNQIFVFDKKVLINHLANYKDVNEKSDSSESNSFADGIDGSDNESEHENSHKKGKAKFTGSHKTLNKKPRGHDS